MKTQLTYSSCGLIYLNKEQLIDARDPIYYKSNYPINSFYWIDSLVHEADCVIPVVIIGRALLSTCGGAFAVSMI